MDTTQSIYSRLGGERILREFVDNLYDFMDHFPAVEGIRDLHPEDLTNSRDRLFMFLSGMLGGPSLYGEVFGRSDLKQKHIHINIGDQERDQWLFCAQNAANQLKVDAYARDDLMFEITVMANHLRNQGEMLSRENGWKSGQSNQLH